MAATESLSPTSSTPSQKGDSDAFFAGRVHTLSNVSGWLSEAHARIDRDTRHLRVLAAGLLGVALVVMTAAGWLAVRSVNGAAADAERSVSEARAQLAAESEKNRELAEQIKTFESQGLSSTLRDYAAFQKAWPTIQEKVALAARDDVERKAILRDIQSYKNDLDRLKNELTDAKRALVTAGQAQQQQPMPANTGPEMSPASEKMAIPDASSDNRGVKAAGTR